MHGKLFLSLVSKIPHICLIHTYSLLVTFTFVKYYGSTCQMEMMKYSMHLHDK